MSTGEPGEGCGLHVGSSEDFRSPYVWEGRGICETGTQGGPGHEIAVTEAEHGETATTST